MSEKCKIDDPNRCKGVTPHGQCEYLARQDEKFCDFHTRGHSKKRAEQSERRRYLLDNAEMREALDRQRDDLDYLNLKEEILVTQMMLERQINKMDTGGDFTSGLGQYNQLVQRLESMKISLLKIQQQLGLVLGKDALRQLGRDLGEILNEELESVENKEAMMDAICERFLVAIEKAGKPKEAQ